MDLGDCMDIAFRKAIKSDKDSINTLFIEMVKTVNERMIKDGIEPNKELENGYNGELDKFFDNDNYFIYVACDNDKVIGFISICVFKDLDYIYVDDYSVNCKYRGLGIGSKLMEMAFRYAEDNNISTVKGHVESANHESIEFYKKRGFTIEKNEGNRLLIKR